MKKALIYGIVGSLFFAATFILNRSMNLTGGYWMWSGILRYVFGLPLMWVIVKWRYGTERIHREIRKNKGKWLLWSIVGFGIFYVFVVFASNYGESWFVAATWQITIVSGVLLTPVFHKPIPKKNLMYSFVILVGIALLQVEHIAGMNLIKNLVALFFIIIGSILYPLGNRKMLEYCPEEISTTERVYGMFQCSMPFWLLCAAIVTALKGLPSAGQCVQAFGVALFSGVLGTLLFFEATNLVKHNIKQLAVIEATQSGEVIFTLLGGILILGDPMPGLVGFLGIIIIVIGMIGNSLAV